MKNLVSTKGRRSFSRQIHIVCPSCLDPLLVAQRYYPDIEDEGYGRANVLYPLRDFHINPAIPELLRRALFEVELCLKAGANTSSVVMCRRALEGFATINDVKERNLKEAILSLSKKEVINQQLFEWADQLRLSGNEAAHSIDVEFSAEDLR